MKGYLHSIESFSTLDGPGLRSVVFLQGCPLRCVYCHNPDSWLSGQGTLVDSSDIFSRIRKNLNYISRKGGVTISGGEPTYQIDFLLELLQGFKAMGLHTAVDTSGYVTLENVQKIMDYTDLFLVDIKHLDSEICRKLTGQSNEKALALLDYLADCKQDVWIRSVLLAGITDQEEYIRKLSSYLAKFKNVSRLELLPCHNLAADKYARLGLENVNPRLAKFDDYALRRIRRHYNEYYSDKIII